MALANLVSRNTVLFLGLFVGIAMCTSMWNDATPVQEKIQLMKDGKHNPYREFNHWLNSFVFSEEFMAQCSARFGEFAAHYLLTYARDLLAAWIVYYSVAGMWHIWIYRVKGAELFTKNGFEFPSSETILDQIMLAHMATFMYAGVPVFSEWLVETGITKTYFYMEEVGGLGKYLFYTALYMFLVEIGVYWMHRELHEIKWAYKYIHALHHKYNKHETLSPWCSIAFNPVDGVLQASPYIVVLIFVPCHYITHLLLVFFTGVWATNIHDAIDYDSEPIMGSKYHTMHHTHYHCNFGQFTIFADWLFGTLKVPAHRQKKL